MSNPAYTSPSYLGAPITGTQQAAVTPQLVHQLWAKGFEQYEISGDFWARMIGNSAMSVIQQETDTSKGAGQKITFGIGSGFFAEPHMGEELFNDSSHFEELKTGYNDLYVDWFRHGFRLTERTEEAMGMRGEIVPFVKDLQDGTNEKAGSWHGRLKSEQLFMMFRESLSAESIVDISSATNSTLSYDVILENSTMMKRWGAPPAMAGTGGKGQPLRRYMVVATTDALLSLEQDGTYRDMLKLTRDEGAAGTLFDGGWTDVRGHAIAEYEAIDHDGYGATGSPLNPTARLGTAITVVTASNLTPLYIVGGGSDYDATNILIKPMKYFPNFAYRFTPTIGVTVSGTAFYVAVVNPPNAVTDANKWGMFKCTTNDGVRLTVTDVLVDGSTVAAGSGSGGGPTLATTLGSVTWSASLNSNTHAVDSFVLEVTAAAKPKFRSLILGACAARRGYGKHRGVREEETKEGTFLQQAFFKSVFGQAPRTNRRGRSVGAICLTHTGKMAGMSLLPSG